MDDAKLFQTAPGVRVRQEGDEHFLVYYDENGYETNAVGAWLIERARDTPYKLQELCESVYQEFDAPFEQVRADVGEVIREFLILGIFQEQEK